MNFSRGLKPYVLSLLRAVTGLLFLEHGAAKLFGFPPAPPFATMPHLPLMLQVAGVLEFFGGILVCIGLFTRPAAFTLSGEMAVGYFLYHAPKSLFPLINGGDAAVLYCFIFLYLAVEGGGSLALERLASGIRLARDA